MFEYIKRLFRRRTQEEPDPAIPERTPTPVSTTTAPAPPPATSADKAADPSPPAAGGKELIQLSLRSVVLKLPETLKDKAKQPPSGGVRIGIPATKILPQLTQGTVRITFGELRKASPPGVFSDSSDRDHTLVDLPLQEILQQLKPDQLPRRLRQKRIEVPDEVVPIFSPQRGQSSVRIAKTPPAEPLRPRTEPAPSPAHARSALGTITPSVPLPRPSALKGPAAGPAQPPPIRPSTPLPPLGAPPSRPSASTPAPAPVPSVKPAAPPPSAPKPAAPKPEPTPAATPSTPASGEFISVPLASVTTGWPEPIRHALAGLNAPNATLNLPSEETEQALKRGKVVFSWKRLKPLVRPPLKTALAPALDEVQLELPLPAIAPLFMAQRKGTSAQRKYDVGEDIPDVFSGRGLAAAHTPAAPSAKAAAPATTAPARPAQPTPATAPAPLSEPVTAPKPPPVPPPAPTVVKQDAHAAPAPVSPPQTSPAAPPAAGAGSEARDIGEVFGQPGRKNWAPAEIAQRTAALKGVAGAVIAMQDGLLIAGQLPAGLNGETISAFLPQLFSRTMQYSKELKFADSDHVTFIIHDVPLCIYRVGGVYFATLGRAGEPLPDAALRLIASHLGPQSK